MTVRENVIVKKINLILAAHGEGVQVYRPVPGIYGKRHLDYIICAYGYYVAIEVKRPRQDATPKQKGTMAEVQAARGATFLVRDVPSLLYLEQWLNWCRSHPLSIDNWPRAVPD